MSRSIYIGFDRFEPKISRITCTRMSEENDGMLKLFDDIRQKSKQEREESEETGRIDKATQTLLDDLSKQKQSTSVLGIVENAKNFRYHDFSSSDIFPKMLLMKHLRSAGLDEMAEFVKSGRYDN